MTTQLEPAFAFFGSAGTDLAALLQRAVRQTARMLDASGAMIYLYDGERDRLRWAYDAGISDERELAWVRALEIPIGVGLFGRAVAEDRLMVSDDYSADRRFRHAPDLDRFVREVGVRSMIVAPMVGADGPLGAIGAYARRTGAFGEPEMALIGALAGHGAIAIENARLIERLRASQDELSRRAAAEHALREIAAGITAIRDPAEIRQRVADESRRLLAVDGAHLALLDEGVLHSAVVAGDLAPDDRAWLLDLRLPAVGGLLTAAIDGRSIVAVSDRLSMLEGQAGQEAELATRLGLRGAALAPLVVEGAAIGLLTVWSREARVFRIDELDLLKGLADQAAIAVDNARLLAVRRESEERYRQLAERSPDLVWVLDMDERFVYFNDRLMAFTGFEPEEFLGKKNIAIVHPSSLPAIDAWLDAVHAGIAGGRIDPAAEQHLRFALRHRDGHPVPVELRSIGIVTDGVQRGWQAAVRDVAELDRLERELRASETRYRTLTENSPDVIWALDLDDRFEYVSSRIEAFTGRPASEYEGLRLIDVLHEASRPAIVARFDQVRADIAAGRIDPAGERSYRFALEHADGSAVPVELRSIGIVVDGALRGWQGSVRDMREVERLERGLRESEERYRLLTERSPDLIVAVDADTRITFVSGRAEALIGWSPDELLGRNAAEIVHPDSVKDLEARWQERRRQPAVEQLQRVLVRHRDGRAVPVEMRSVGIVVDGKLLGEQSSLRDMTERDRMERELRRHAAELAASQERAHLAQELHDSVTQALFSMTLTTRSAEMLLSRDPAAAAQKLTELRELGKDALTEMRSLIFELRPGSLEQDGLVVALRKHAAAVQGRTGLPVVVEIDECPRLPLELEGALYRIAQEALHNVIKHARASQVRIELEQANHGVRMRIVDDGRGFDAARRPEGGHLGLAGMAARAERVGAILEVRSQVGEGTTIEVSAETDSLRDDGGDGTPVDPRAVGHGLAGADAADAPDGIDAADGIAATDATDGTDPADSADARVAGGGV